MKTLYFYLSILLFAVVSCNREGDEDVKKTNAVDVYVSGIDDYKAVYWKNGIKTYLDGGYSYVAEKITLDNNNLYFFGYTHEMITQQNFSNYCFWKNGVKTNIAQYLNVADNTPTNPDNLKIKEMIVHNGDIYFYGSIKNLLISTPNQTEVCVWKNGVKIYSLTNNQTALYATNFMIFNNDIYYTAQKFTSYYIGEILFFKNGVLINTITNANDFQFINIGNNLYSHVEKYNFTSNNVITTNTFEPITGSVQIQFPNSLTYSNVSKVMSFGNDLYYYWGNSAIKEIYKNGTSYTFPYNDPNGYNNVHYFIIKDQNYYSIKMNNSSGTKMFINGTETLYIPDMTKGCFYDILVVNQ